MTALTAPPTAGDAPASPLDDGAVGVRLRATRWHGPLLTMSGVGLLLGTYTGLGRAGSAHRMLQPDVHGVIMVLGFLGLLIALERASALGSWPAYLAPTLTAASTVLLATPLSRILAGVLLAGAGGLVAVTYVGGWRRTSLHEALLFAGAAAWTAAATFWTLGSGPLLITPLLAALLVLTVIGWRRRDGQLGTLEGRSLWFFVAVASIFVVGVAISPIDRSVGLLIAGIGLVGLAPGLVRHDVARAELRSGGVRRFSAWSTTLGYVWLGVSGCLWVAMGSGITGPLLHDALVHSLFLGFVLSWLMGQAPSLLPALIAIAPIELGVRWLPLALLQVSVALRITADLAGSFAWREMALHGNVAALTAFVIIEVVAVRRGVLAVRPRERAVL